MKRYEGGAAARWLGALALAATGLAPNVSAQGALHELQVVVWGTDGTVQPEVVVAARDDAGVMVKATPLPSGSCMIQGLGAKTLIEVRHETLGRVEFEVLMPRRPVVLADVLYIEPGLAELIIDQPTKSLRTSGFTFGDPPPNDLCQNATPITLPADVMGSTVDATLDSDFDGCSGGYVTSPGVWYTVVGTGNILVASTCSDLFDYDTKLTVFCGTCDEETCIVGNDDACAEGASGLLSSVFWCSQEGASYNILVHGFGDQTGSFRLLVGDSDIPCTPPVYCAPAGACCLPSGECVSGMTEADCEALNGYYQGDDVRCESVAIDYALNDCSSEFEDIRGFGTPGPSGDDAFAVAPLGFEFTYWENRYTHVLMSTNGYLTFGSDGDEFENHPCPDPEEPNDGLWVLWDDLVVDGPGQTDFITLGTEPNRRFIAQWTNVRHILQPMSANTFQAVLHESNSSIEYRYLSLDGIPMSPGDTTIGIEDRDGIRALCIEDSEIDGGTCFRFDGLFLPPLVCPCRFVDFETEDDFTTPLVNGQDLSFPDEFGHLFKLDGYGAGNLGAAVFDSDPSGPNGWGPDPDLLVDTGNLVILQSLAEPDQTVPGVFNVPDDCTTGGVFTIEFPGPVEPRRIDFVDIDEGDFLTQMFLTDCYGYHRTYVIPGGWTTDLFEQGPPGYGTLFLDTLLPQPGENGTYAIGQEQPGFDPCNVIYIEIHMGNSGAIDNFEFCLPSHDGGPV